MGAGGAGGWAAASPHKGSQQIHSKVCELQRASPYYTGRLYVALTFCLFRVFKKLFLKEKQ